MTMTTATTSIRKTLICALTTVTLAVPTLATAGFSSRIKAVKSNNSTLITNVQKKAPIKAIARKARENQPEIFDNIRDMQVLEQLKQAMGMIKQAQMEYEYFSGGEGCAATCASFRSRLKSILNDALALSQEVPALNSQGDLLENLQRMSAMIDYVPPRALFLMWQTVGAKMEELEATVDGIRQTLMSLPPLADPATFDLNALIAGDSNAATSKRDEMCEWLAQTNQPILDLVQGRLEMTAWALAKSADMIPSLSVEAEGGASGGAGVANVTASATVGIKPTDSLKLTLKLLAYFPERINWAIKLNKLRAKVVCKLSETHE